MTAQTCHDIRESYRSSLVGIELDDTQTQMLLSIARKHCKLALEHSQASTTRERRQEIIEEIESLRSVRDGLIDEFRKSQNNGFVYWVKSVKKKGAVVSVNAVSDIPTKIRQRNTTLKEKEQSFTLSH